MTGIERGTRIPLLCAAMSLFVGGTQVAHAALGDTAASVQGDGVALRASGVTTTPMAGYDRHDLEMADGGSVHEFAAQAGNGAGTVFAVTFASPTMPDLKTVLGAHYDSYLAAARAHHGNHHVLSFVADDGMVVAIVKLQRGFQGQAHLPAEVPRGVTMQDLR